MQQNWKPAWQPGLKEKLKRIQGAREARKARDWECRERLQGRYGIFRFQIYWRNVEIMITLINDTLIKLFEVTMTSYYLNNLLDVPKTIWRMKPEYTRNCNKLNSTRIRSRRRDLNPGHVGGRFRLSPLLSSLRHPCCLN